MKPNHPHFHLISLTSQILIGIGLVSASATADSSGSLTTMPTSQPVSPQTARRIDLTGDLYLRSIGDGAYVISHVFPGLSNSVLVEMADGTFVMAGTPYTPDATGLVLA